jgi:hypothetical protein
MLALDDSGIEYVEDLAGKPVSVGMTASATEIGAKIAFVAAGIPYPDGIKASSSASAKARILSVTAPRLRYILRGIPRADTLTFLHQVGPPAEVQARNP